MGPHLTIMERLGGSLRMILPYSLLTVLIVLNVVSMPAPLSVVFKAPFFLMGLYYWSIYRPTLIPPWLVFLIGLFVDLLTGLPLGFHPALFLLCRVAVVDQRRFLVGQNFVVLWLGFAFLNGIFFILQWVIFVVISGEFLPYPELLRMLFLGIVLFPLVCVLLNLTHKALPDSLAR